jgi:hypothetical protein
MEALLVQPKNAEELALLQSMLKKMSIGNRVISIEDKEDFGLLMLMQKADRSKRVSRDTVMKKFLKPKSTHNKLGAKFSPKLIFKETEKSVAIKPMDESYFDAMMGILEKGDLQKEKATLRNEELAKEKNKSSRKSS